MIYKDNLSIETEDSMDNNSLMLQRKVPLRLEGYIDKQASQRREPHECQYCETSFTTISILMKHITDTYSENVGHKIVYLEPRTKPVKKTRSLVWNFAEKLDNFAKFNFCKNLFRTSYGNTTGILNHLKTRHPEEIEKDNIHVQRTSESIPELGLRGLVESDGKPLDMEERNGEPDQKRTRNILDIKNRVSNPLEENDTPIESDNLIGSNQVIQNKAMIWNHAYKLEEGTMCKYCGKTFIDNLGLINHVYREHPEKMDVQQPKIQQKLILNKKRKKEGRKDHPGRLSRQI